MRAGGVGRYTATSANALGESGRRLGERDVLWPPDRDMGEEDGRRGNHVEECAHHFGEDLYNSVIG